MSFPDEFKVAVFIDFSFHDSGALGIESKHSVTELQSQKDFGLSLYAFHFW